MAETTSQRKGDFDSFMENVASIKFLGHVFSCGCTHENLSTIQCASTPNWMNRWKCLKCGKFFSR